MSTKSERLPAGIEGNQGSQGNTYLQGFKDCIPTLLGYLSIGFAAGVVERTAGFSLLEITLISLLLYAGSGQFIAAGMIAAASPILSIIVTIFLLMPGIYC